MFGDVAFSLMKKYLSFFLCIEFLTIVKGAFDRLICINHIQFFFPIQSQNEIATTEGVCMEIAKGEIC